MRRGAGGGAVEPADVADAVALRQRGVDAPVRWLPLVQRGTRLAADGATEGPSLRPLALGAPAICGTNRR